MLFRYQDLNKKEQSIELPITVDKFIEVKSEVKGLELSNIEYYWTFWEIRDVLFKQLMFDIHKHEIMSFLKILQTNNFDFIDSHKGTIVKAVDIYYNVYYGDFIFVAGEPCTTIYGNDIIEDIGRLELHLDFDTEELEYLLVQLLEALGITGIEDYQEEEELSTSELSTDGYFEDLIRTCWLETKQQTNSKVVGIIFQASGCGSMSDLDTGENIEETTEGMTAHLKGRGAF
jgi:hypothetical protein